MGDVVEPKVFLLGETQVNQEGVSALMEHLGVPGWASDANTSAELLTEIYGRCCYRSFGTDLNPNLTRVRPTNKAYITNTLEKGDGSIFEHAVVNFFFADVSRVFTHELVRHRTGTAMSQESLRFARLTDLNWYAPVVIKESPEAMEIYADKMEELSRLQTELSDLFEIDGSSKNFDTKKKMTSAFRRLAPMGLATNIGWSANMRSIRHVIEMRTHPGAEEEIRLVFGQVAEISISRWGNIFADYEHEIVDGLPWYKSKNKKV